MTSRLHLLITYFSLQTALFDDPFHANGTFRGKLTIFHSIFKDKATKVIHNNFRNGVTNGLNTFFIKC